MVYAMKYRVCNSCGEHKPEVDFYKTIKNMCKMCRDEYVREARHQSKEEEENANKKRDRDIKRLKKMTNDQAEIIDEMETKVRSMERKMSDMKIKLDDLSSLEAKLKGASMRKLKVR